MNKPLLFVAGATVVSYSLGVAGLSLDSYALEGTVNNLITNGESVVDVVLDEAVTEDIVVPAGKTVNLNLNGNNVTGQTCHAIEVELGGTLNLSGAGEIKAGSGSSCAALYNNGTAEVSGGTLKNGEKSYYVVLNHGDLTMNDGVTVESTFDNSSAIENGYYDYTNANEKLGHKADTNKANPTLVINGGDFDGGLNTVKNDDGGVLTINDGTFRNTTQVPVFNGNVVNINGGDFEATGTEGSAKKTVIYSVAVPGRDQNKGQMSVAGGTFKGEYLLASASSAPYGPGNVVISDGDFTGITENIINKTGGLSAQLDKDTVTISGGEFDAENEELMATVEDLLGSNAQLGEDGKVVASTSGSNSNQGVSGGAADSTTDDKKDTETIVPDVPKSGVMASEEPMSSNGKGWMVVVTVAGATIGAAMLVAKRVRKAMRAAKK